jgi:hypothetical protein
MNKIWKGIYYERKSHFHGQIVVFRVLFVILIPISHNSPSTYQL